MFKISSVGRFHLPDSLSDDETRFSRRFTSNSSFSVPSCAHRDHDAVILSCIVWRVVGLLETLLTSLHPRLSVLGVSSVEQNCSTKKMRDPRRARLGSLRRANDSPLHLMYLPPIAFQKINAVRLSGPLPLSNLDNRLENLPTFRVRVVRGGSYVRVRSRRNVSRGTSLEIVHVVQIFYAIGRLRRTFLHFHFFN